MRADDSHPSLTKNWNFWLLWWAVGVSAFGDHLAELGLMRWLELDQRPNQTQIQAQMTFVFFLPFVFIGPIAGWLADRVARRGLMIFADVVRCAVVAMIPLILSLSNAMFAGAENLPFVGDHAVLGALLPLLIVGAFATLFSPSRHALLPSLVPDRDLTRANSLINGLSITGATLSYMAGGWLAQINPLYNFRIDAATFAFSAVMVFFIAVPKSMKVTAAPHAGPKSVSRRGGVREAITEITDGFRYVAGHRRVWQLILLATVFWAAAGAFQSFIPTVVFNTYRPTHAWITPENQYEILGYFKGGIAIGMLCGALLLTYFADSLRGQWVIGWSLVFAGIAAAVFAFVDNIFVGGVMLVLIGMFGGMMNISIQTLLQRCVPNRSRGRVFGVRDLSTMLGLLAATGVLGLGMIDDLDHLTTPVLVALGVVLTALGVYMTVDRLRRSPLGWELQAYKNFNEFYCKWWFRCRREGPCTIPREGSAVVVANHRVTIDPFLITATSPYRVVSFMMAREYSDIPIWLYRRILSLLGCIPVARDGKDVAGVRAAMRALRDGKAIGIFPEGGIPFPDEKRAPKAGMVELALRSGSPVIPLYISGTRWSHATYMPFLWRHHAVVRYGNPIDLSAYADRVKDREAMEEAAIMIMDHVRALAPDDGGGEGSQTATDSMG